MAVKKSSLAEQESKAPKANATTSASAPKTTTKTTKIKVRCNCGFNNNLYIRGHGANLSWDKGHLLKNVKADEWVWETSVPFTRAEFKILINDRDYEHGENHHISHGDTIEHTPRF